MKLNRPILALAAICLLSAACTREELSEHSKDIHFGAKTPVSHITKTVYSYHQETVGTELWERIDWENGDLIRILCDATSPKYFDYDIALASTQGVTSFATAAPHGAEHGLQWGSGTHTFFSMYPSEAASGVQSGVALELTGSTTARATAVLPADQSASARTVTLDDSSAASYYGNMNLAYMTAAVEAAEGTEEVTLSFKSMVTTFFVMVVNTTGNPMTLKKVELTSSSSALTGQYRIALDKNNSRPGSYQYWDGSSWVNSLSASGRNSIYAAFPSGVSIPASGNNSITVALFALPHEITNLTLTVTADETGPISLPIKYNGSFLSFAGENKHNINNVSVPAVSYTLDVDETVITYDYTGAYTPDDQEFTVTSFKTIGSSVIDTPWETQIWIDADDDDIQDDSEWNVLADVLSDPAYSWLSGFPTTSASACLDPDPDLSSTTRTFQKSVAAQTVISHEDRLKSGVVYDTDGVTPVVHNSAATAVDLSYYDFVNRKLEPHRYTANTYIVSGPGYYKIPLVFGNAIENDQRVPDSYSGRPALLGHLDEFICPLPGGTESSIHLVSTRPWLNEGRSMGARIHWEKYSYWDQATDAVVTSHRKWSQAAGTAVVDDLSIVTGSGNERYLVFHVSEDHIRPGNLILASMSEADGTGNVCWSWQIWITDQDMRPVTINNGTSDYAILPVNLGWTDLEKGLHYNAREAVLRFASTEKAGLVSAHTLTVRQAEKDLISTNGWSTFYQWGRKDPMTDGPTEIYDNDGYVHESIKHPGNIMYDKGSFFGERYYDWTVHNYNNLWESKNTSWESPSGDLPNHKTVYDPSPRRYCVPPDNTFDGFGTYGYSQADASGIYFYTNSSMIETVFFPAAGSMDYINAQSSQGDDHVNGYWTYHPWRNVQRRTSYAMTFTYNTASSSATVNLKDYNERDRAYGFSVRPISYYLVGMTEQEVVFADAGWTDGQEVAGQSYTVGNVTVSVARQNNLGTVTTASYSASTQSLVLNRYHDLTIHVASGNISEITLNYGTGDGGDSVGSANISIQSGGGTYSNGYWYANYSNGILTPSTNTVVLQTAATGDARIIQSITVSYKE